MNQIIKRLLCAALLILPAAFLSAEEENLLQVIVQGAPASPVAGTTWTLTLFISHSDPNRVTVIAPHFSGNLYLDQVLKGPHLRNPATGQTATNQNQTAFEANSEEALLFEQWTAMEYRFTPISSGTISFDSFTVITPAGRANTLPFEVEVLRAANTAEVRRYQLSWQHVPSSMRTGENAVVSLRLHGWNAMVPMPQARLFLPPAPQGVIMETLPVSAEERAAGTVLQLQLLPIEAAPLVFGARQIQQDSSVFEIPALRIPVNQATGQGAESPANAAAVPSSPAEASPSLPFPSLETLSQGNFRLYQRHQAESNAVYEAARNQWEQGNRANALATLRQHEREHHAGVIFGELRRKAENILGLSGTNNESRSNALSFLQRNPRTAVLKETALRSIPDMAGVIIGHFREGQPVLILQSGSDSGRREQWLRVSANDSSSVVGWVLEENAVFY